MTNPPLPLPSSTGDSPTKKKGLGISFELIASVVFALWLLGQIFKERFYFTGLCFYIPSVLVAGIFAVVAARRIRKKRKLPAVLSLIIFLLPLGMLLFAENHWTRPESPDSTGRTIRLVHWNVANGRLGWQRVQDEIVSLKPDIAVISEAPGRYGFDDLARRLGGFTISRVTNLAVIASGELTHGARLSPGAGKAYLFENRAPSWNLSLLVVDLPSDPLMPRAHELQWVTAQMEALKPDFVVGDFNALRRSSALCNLPAPYAHAYDRTGFGYSATWPMPLPIYAIDQCILGKRVHPVKYRIVHALRSDHCAQVLDFKLEE